MRSLSQGILIIVILILLIISLLGGLTMSNISGLGDASRRLADDVLAEEQALTLFQISLDRVFMTAVGYTRTRQNAELKNGRDAIITARSLLPQLADLTTRNDLDGKSADRQQQRVELVEEAERNLNELEDAARRVDTTRVSLSLRRLDIMAQKSAQLASASSEQLNQLKQNVLNDVQQTYLQGLFGTLLNFGLLAVAAIIIMLFVRQQVIRPLIELLGVVVEVGHGSLDQRVTVTSRHEIGRLQAGFNTMIDSIRQQRQAIDEHTAALERSYQTQAHLLETVNALSSPIMPVLDRVLVLPIVGHVDAQRAERMTATLLVAVHEQRAKFAILDLTGLAAIDATIQRRLMALIRATELLGTRVYLAGISPEFAEVITDLEGMEQLMTYRSLREAVAAAASHMKMKVRRVS